MAITERRIVAIVLMVLSCGLVVSTFGLNYADLGGAFSPMFFPRIVLVILAGLAALNVYLDMRAGAKPKPIELKPALIISVAFVAYVLLLVPLGYFFSSVMMGLVVLLALGIRSPLMLAAVPILSAGTLIALFNHVLKMPLPSSPLVWWL